MATPPSPAPSGVSSLPPSPHTAAASPPAPPADAWETEEKEEDAPELAREPSTPAIGQILHQISRLPLADKQEVKEGLDRVVIKRYLGWCEERDKWLGVPELEKNGTTAEKRQWTQWNKPNSSIYKGDGWSLGNGIPVRKGKESIAMWRDVVCE